MPERRDDDMPVPKMSGKPSRAMRVWPSVTTLVCLVLTTPLLWLWYHARDDGASGRQRLITLAVVIGIPVVVWTALGCSTLVRTSIRRVALRLHLIPAEAAGRRVAAILPVCVFVGSYLWWLLLFSGTAWAMVAVFAVFAVPAIPMMADPDHRSDASWARRDVGGGRRR